MNNIDELKAKRAAYAREWRSGNKDKVKATYERNKHKYAEQNRARKNAWYVENRELACATERDRRKQSYVHVGYASGARNSMWKGDNVGYHGLHKWVYRNLGKPLKCEFCSVEEGTLQWANKSHEYKREVEDWIPLCAKCHYHYDRQEERRRDNIGRYE